MQGCVCVCGCRHSGVGVQQASGGAGTWGGGMGGRPTTTPGSRTLGARDLPEMWGDLSQTWKPLRSRPSHLELLRFLSGQWPPSGTPLSRFCPVLPCVLVC